MEFWDFSLSEVMEFMILRPETNGDSFSNTVLRHYRLLCLP